MGTFPAQALRTARIPIRRILPVAGKPSGNEAVLVVRNLSPVYASIVPHTASREPMRNTGAKAPFRPNAFCSRLRFPNSATCDRPLNLVKHGARPGSDNAGTGGATYGSSRLRPGAPGSWENASMSQGLPTHMSDAHAPTKAWIEMPRPVLSSGNAFLRELSPRAAYKE